MPDGAINPSSLCSQCHAQVIANPSSEACPACGGKLIPNPAPAAASPALTDHRGIILPLRHAVGGVITPR